MKAKLHKMESGYILSLNGDIDDPYAIVNKELAEDYEWYKLSLKNCQAIECGYDLDELAENFWKEEFMKPGLIDTNSYKKGFQKALEILNDKKFSELQLNDAIAESWNSCEDNEGELFSDVFKRIKQTLQQTEWEVEIEVEDVYDGLDEMAQPQYSKQPKLDTNGCLTLKRI